MAGFNVWIMESNSVLFGGSCLECYFPFTAAFTEGDL